MRSPLSALIMTTALSTALAGFSSILLAEEELTTRQSLDHWQTQMGATVVAAGKEALAQMQKSINEQLRSSQPRLMFQILADISTHPESPVSIKDDEILAAE